MNLRDAAQQALDALESEHPDIQLRAAIALRAALEQPEQEPVAWMVYTLDGKSAFVTDNPADFGDQHRALPLYTHPPRREWQGMTDDELTALGIVHSRYQEESLETGGWFDFARAIEAALKEKNK